MSDDYAADTQTTGTVAVGGSATGTIETAHDQDWFAVELVAGRTYVIDLRGNPTDDGTLRDPYLRAIYDADGNRISNTTDDDGGEGYNSRLTFTATESGTHYIAAGAYSSRQGTYEVEVTDTSPPIVGPDPDSGGPPDRQEQVQQEPPAFGSQFYAFDLAEDTDGSTDRISLGTVSATDPEDATVSYSIEGGNAAGLFEIDAASGELFYTGGGEDHETGSTGFELTVRASDGDQTTDTTVTVNVTDVAEAPAFAQAGYAFDLVEDTDGSANRISLGTVSATDPDGGSVTYSIGGGNAAALFEIDAASGELFYTGGGEDYETGSTSFELTVRASDGDQTTDATVTVNVTDVDEPVEVDPPVVQPDQSTPQTVSEPAGEDFPTDPSTSGRVAVGDTATGSIGSSGDRDWYAVELVAGRTYVINLRGSPTDDGTLSDPFLRGIYDADGNRISNTMDDDGGQGYNSRVTFTATESGTHYIAAGAYSSRQGTYEVEVTDTSPPETPQEQVQQQPPAFDRQAYLFDLAENADGSANRISLGSVSATDPDGGSVSYGIEGGNAAARFEIDAASGELFYVGGGEDYETGSTRFELTVRASDGEQTTDTSVTVNVTDVAEAPAFAQAGYAFDLEENADGSTNRLSLGTVSATDPDGGSVSYGIAGGNESGLFEIDAASGELFYVGGGEDYETGSGSFELTVRASDGEQTTDATVTVNVTDAAEAPAFAQAGYTFDLAENADGSANRLSLGTVLATDPDGGSVTYSIEGGNAAGLFEIDAASGELFYVGAGEDYETGSTSFELTVRASDGDQTTDATVTVNVTDVDEPVAVEPPVAQEVQSTPQTVSEGAADLPNDNTTPGRVAVGGSATGTIGTAYDHDRFAVDLVGGRTYQFDLEGSPGGGGTLPDTYFRAIYNSEGRYQSNTYNDNFEGSRDSRVTFTPTESGTYYARVSGDRNETGSYTLSVTDVTPPEAGGSTTDPVIPEPQEPTVEFVGPDQDAQTSPAQGVQSSVSEGDTDLPADTTTPGRVVVGGSATGNVEARGDHDWFAMTLQAGKVYQIDLEGRHTERGTLADPELYGLYDADGTFIDGTDANQGGGVGGNARLYFTPEESATYYAAVGAYAIMTGTYTLSVTEFTDDHGATPDTAGTVAVNSSVEGRIEPPGDHDWFAVDLEAGEIYRFDLEGKWTYRGTLWDPHLHGIYTADEVLIDGTADDYSGVLNNSQTHFEPSESGTYYVAARADGGEVGTYTLTVIKVADDYGTTPDTAGTVDVGGMAEGKIEHSDDRDWFAVGLQGGRTYQVDLAGRWTAGPHGLGDPKLYGIYDADENRIDGTSNDDGGPSRGSRVIFTPNADGTYYVEAGSQRGRSGNYALLVADITGGAPDDYGTTPDTAGTVAVGGSVEGKIEGKIDVDWFAVEFQLGKTYQVAVENQDTGIGPWMDPNVRGIHRANGTPILHTIGDATWGSGGGQVTYTADANATYYVAVGAGGDREGAYTLSVEEVDAM